MNPKVKILFAVSNGFETVEFAAPYDILQRAGAEITIAKVIDPTKPTDKSRNLLSAQNLTILADVLIEEVDRVQYDAIVLPGGVPNDQHLGQDKILIEMLKKQKQEGKLFCAICASPVSVLEKNGLLEGMCATSYPSMQNQLKNQEKVKDRVVICKNWITSQGPCTGLEFGYAICEALFGAEKTKALKEGMLFQ